MIRGALSVVPGIGPERRKRLAAAGVWDWHGLLAHADEAGLRGASLERAKAAVEEAERAAQTGDIAWFLKHVAPADRWRILAEWMDDASYFDIETDGVEGAVSVTFISCWHQDELRSFVRGENLDEFLDVLDEVRLLVSFNGAAFDVPHIEREFHIPHLPCPHLDLMPVLKREGMTGGLKRIEKACGLERPPDIAGLDGQEAVWLWRLWETDGARAARRVLERYALADALSLKYLAARVVQAHGGLVTCPSSDALWSFLPPAVDEEGGLLPRSPAPVTPVPSVPVAEAATDPLTARLERHWRNRRGRIS